MASLVDTNILIYRCDPRDSYKQQRAQELLDEGLTLERLILPHQAIVEFVAAATRPLPGGGSLLPREEALRQAEDLLVAFPVVYPDADLVRTALRGMVAYQLPWFDAHLWAYAEHYGLPEILSEDFEHGRLYGAVRVTNPFLRPSRD